MSIAQIAKWVKGDQGQRTLLSIAVILAIFLAFGLGRLSTANHNTASVVDIEYPSYLSNELTVVPQNLPYVASRNGTKYYATWCSSATRISDINKVYFTSIQEAIDAGYDKAKNCSF